MIEFDSELLPSDNTSNNYKTSNDYEQTLQSSPCARESIDMAAVLNEGDKSDITEISSLHKFSSNLHNELLVIESQITRTPLAPLRSDSRDSDDDLFEESMMVMDERSVHGLYLDIEDRVSAYCTPMKKSTAFQESAPSSHGGFTPMTLSQLLEIETPSTGIDELLNILRDLRTPRLQPMPNHQPSRRLPSLRSKRLDPTDFFSSAFNEDVDDSFDESDFLKSRSSDVESESTNAVNLRIFDLSSHKNSRDVVSTDLLRQNWDMEEKLTENIDNISRAEINLKKEVSQRYLEQYKRVLASSSAADEFAKGSNSPNWKYEVLNEAGLQAAIEYQRSLKGQAISTESSAVKSLMKVNISDSDINMNDWENLDESDLSAAPINSNAPYHYFDDRTKADFTLWRSGTKLTWQGLKDSYAGLFDSLLNSSSNGSTLVECVCVMECVVRPDVELKRIMAAILRTAHAINCKFQLLKRSHALLTRDDPSTTSSSSATPSTGNMITSTFASAFGTATSQVPSSGAHDVEWDFMDAQVCISKELRQRVILCMFVRKAASHSMMRLTSPRAGQTRVPVGTVTGTLQKLLMSSRLCLSALYRTNPTSVCPGDRLDGHFAAQIQTLFRESMWLNLHEVFLSMDEYSKQIEATSHIIEQTMEPIFKQHGIAPSAIPRLRIDELKMGSAPPSAARGEPSISENDSDPMNPRFLSVPESADSDRDEDVDADPFFDFADQYPKKTYVDGMAKCLEVVSNHFQELQAKFDAEFSARLQRKHDLTFKVIDGIFSFRQSILIALAKSPMAQNSPLTKSFKSAMTGVKVTIGRAPHTPSNRRSSLDSQTATPKHSEDKSKGSWVVLSAASPVAAVPTPASTKTKSQLTEVLFPSPPKLHQAPPSTPQRRSTILPLSAPLVTLPGTVATTRDTGKPDLTIVPPSPLPSPTGLPLETPVMNSNQSMMTNASFKPTSDKAKTTAMKIKKHLEEFRKTIDEDVHISSVMSTRPLVSPSSVPSVEHPQLRQHKTFERSDGFHRGNVSESSTDNMSDVVIYYCTCIVNGMPGTLYVTPNLIGTTSGWITGISQYRELFPLNKLDVISIHSTANSLFPSNTMKLSFFGGQREVVITPLVVDSTKIRLVLTDAIAAFQK